VVKPAANDEMGGGRLIPMLREMMRNGQPPGMISMTDPGRIRLKNWALLDLIAAAYRVHASQVSGRGWIADVCFDIDAKVPEGTPKEELNAMLQSLLEERFGLQVHRETQTKQGFPLVGRNNASWPSLTTEELAYRLARFAEAPVVDMTGLTGKYAVTIETWKNADVPGGTVFDAVEKLGLRLEPRKVTVETVVVDQVSKTPTAN
jgi:hypothetical protein